MAAQRQPYEHPPCTWCGKVFPRRKKEERAAFCRRQTCCLKCAQAQRGAVRTQALIEALSDRRCAYSECGRALVKSPKESTKDFQRRKFCCSYCRYAAKELASGRFNGGPWPVPTGEIDFGNGFAAHNIEPKDGGVIFRANRTDRQSYSGCSAEWAALP